MATKLIKLISIFFILISIFSTLVVSESSECEDESNDKCNNKQKALPLKIIAIFSILITSMIGVTLPLLTRSIPALSPDRSLFVIVKAFAAGIILGTGFMHVLPDSFDMLSSSCLSENPWHKFPFSGFLAMLSAIVTLMVDSMATSFYVRRNSVGIKPETQIEGGDQEMAVTSGHLHTHHHGHLPQPKEGAENSQLLRYRVVAMVIL